MADETSVAAGKRFSQDLRRIREDRGVSIDDIHQETRIARSLIEAFEEGGLYEHETFNKVYLRSFVRAYAEAVGISSDTVRDELDAALEGTYERTLADEYLPGSRSDADEKEDEETGAASSASASSAEPDRSPSEDEGASTPEPPSAGGPEGRGGIVGPARALGEESEEQDTDSEQGSVPSSPEESKVDAGTPLDDAEADEPSSSTPVEEPERAPGDAPEEDQTPAEDAGGLPEDRRPSWMEEDEGEDAPVSPRPEGADEEDVASGEDAPAPPPTGAGTETGIVGEPTAMGGESGDQSSPLAAPATAQPAGRDRSPRRSGWRRWFRGQQREIIWAGAGFLVILLVLVGLAVAFFSTSSETAPEQSPSASTAPASETATTAAADTSRSSPPDPRRPPPANVALGSSIPLTVLATRDVRGIRIERDEDLSRPYWIEEGEAAVFPFQDRAILEDELGDVQLFLAGYPYPESQWDTTGRLVITRSAVEAFVDTLRGAPAALTTTPDTIPKGPPNR